MSDLDRRAFWLQVLLLACPQSIRNLGYLIPLNWSNQNTDFAINIEMWRFGKRTRAGIERWRSQLQVRGVLGRPSNRIQDLCRLRRRLGENHPVHRLWGWGWQGAICNPKAEDRNHTKFVEEVKSSCAVAKALNIPMMTIICGNEVPDVSLEAMHNSVIKV